MVVFAPAFASVSCVSGPQPVHLVLPLSTSHSVSVLSFSPSFLSQVSHAS